MVETNTDGDRNKVISNYHGFMWDTHAKRQYDGSLAAVVSPNEAPVAHGIEPVDATFTSTDTTIGKLISDNMAKNWNDHINVDADPHSQYILQDGSENFADGVGYSSALTIADINTNDFTTKKMLQDYAYGQSIITGDWTDNLDGTYSYQVYHNLGVDYPMVVLWQTGGGSQSIVMPAEVNRIDSWNIEIVVSDISYSHWVRIWYSNQTIAPLP